MMAAIFLLLSLLGISGCDGLLLPSEHVKHLYFFGIEGIFLLLFLGSLIHQIGVFVHSTQ